MPYVRSKPSKPGKVWTSGAQSQYGCLGYREIVPVSLPKVTFLAGEDDPKEVAEQIYTMRTIRAGRDAYEQISKAESFEAWKSIGAALAIGKAHALRVTGANAPWGLNYSREFSRWLAEHHFGTMPKATRSWAT